MKLKGRLSKKGDLPRTERVRIEAGTCRECKSSRSRVYKTQGVHRYCVCDECGHTWSKAGPLANPLIDLANDAVDILANAEIVKTEDSKEVIIIDVKAATDLANRFVAAMP